MDTLAADLEEATSDLLNIPGTGKGRTAPSHTKEPHFAGYSSSSKIQPIHSDDEDAGDGGHVARSRSALKFGKALPEVLVPSQSLHGVQADGEEDGMDLFASLSSRTLPIRPTSSSSTVRAKLSPSPSTPSDLFRRATASPGAQHSPSKVSSPQLPDVWLNRKGEKVMDGVVISRLSLTSADGSRSKSPTRNVARPAPQTGSLSFGGEDLSDNEIAPSSLRRHLLNGSAQKHGDDEEHPSLVPHMPSSRAQSATGFSHWDHGAKQRLHTPAFFRREFDSSSGAGSMKPSSAWWEGTESSRTRITSDDQTQSQAEPVGPAEPAVPLVETMPGKDSQQDQDPLKASETFDPQTTDEQDLVAAAPPSASVGPEATQRNGVLDSPPPDTKVHAFNEPSSSVFSDALAPPRDVQLYGPSTLAKKQGIAWQPRPRIHRRTSSRSSTQQLSRSSRFGKDATVLERAASLFTTPLAAPANSATQGPHDAEYVDEGTWSAGADSVVDDVADEGLERSSLRSLDGDSNSSLLSLPVSAAIGSNSDGASATRSGSLHRRASSGSASVAGRSALCGPSLNVFARDVKVRGWSEVGRRARGYVDFDIVVLTKKGVMIRVHRRYSSFVALRKQLLAEAPPHRNHLPPLPPKDALHKYSAKHLEQRRIALTNWLQAVMLDPRWGGSKAVREWLVGPAS